MQTLDEVLVLSPLEKGDNVICEICHIYDKAVQDNLKISMGEDHGYHEAWVKIWGDARQQKEGLRWNWGE